MAFRWNDLLKQPTTVVPAKAGTHYVCRSNPQGAIGSSLRWSDDGVGQKAVCGRTGAPPTPSLPRGDPCIDLLFKHIERHRP